LKRFAVVLAVLACLAFASAASAQVTGTYTWSPQSIVSSSGLNAAAYCGSGEYGGIFTGTLYQGTTAVSTGYSLCNELGANITGTFQVSVLSLNNSTYYTYDNSGITYNIASSPQAQGAIAYLVDSYLTKFALGTSTAYNTYSVDQKRAALQLAIWKLWGFNISSGLNSSTINALATSLVTEGTANYALGLTSNDVVWVHNPVLANGAGYQDQIVQLIDDGITTHGMTTPEGSSLALLLPGLLPAALILRRKSRKG